MRRDDLPVSAADRLRANFATGLTRPVVWRRQQLGQLSRMLRDEATALLTPWRGLRQAGDGRRG